MVARCLLILGLAVLAPSSEAHKVSNNNGTDTDSLGLLGQVFASLDTEENEAVTQSASKSFVKRSVVDDEGRSLGDHHGAISLEQCQLMCDSKDGCKSFTFKPQQDKLEAWCHLKDRCLDEEIPEKKFGVDTFTTFYKKYVKLTWSERSLVADEGNDVGHLATRSLSECKRKCHAEPRCRSFSWAKDWCLLKDKCVTADAESARHGHVKDTKTYYMPCATSGSATWHQRSLVEVEGSKLSEEILTQRECEIKCDANPLCNSFSFKQDTRTCRLYDKTVTEDEPGQFQASAYHSYYKPC